MDLYKALKGARGEQDSFLAPVSSIPFGDLSGIVHLPEKLENNYENFIDTKLARYPYKANLV